MMRDMIGPTCREFLIAILLSMGMLVTGCQVNEPGNSGKGQQTQTSDEFVESLVAKLKSLKVQGPGRGGPYVGIMPNDVTRNIVQHGQTVVPRLLKRLESSGYDESVYIVFCLRELKAKDTKSTIGELGHALSNKERFAESPHDLTLEMQIRYFLRDAESWN